MHTYPMHTLCIRIKLCTRRIATHPGGNHTMIPFADTPLQRRSLLACAGLLMLPTAWAANTTIGIEVWKDPTCGCCRDWVVHLEKSGFTVKVNDSGRDAARARLGMPQQLASCHTALVAGYAIEGHVPAKEILRLLKEKPAAIGLSVPGMPVGSPGMDGAIYGGRKDAYDVLLVAKDGRSRVYGSYR
jgi:hypothetical protein